MASLPRIRAQSLAPPFYHNSCDYFGPYQVRITRNKRAKYYGVVFTCMITRAIHLELTVDYSTMEFLQTLRRYPGMDWKFSTPAAPHQSGSVESLVKSTKIALKKGDRRTSPHSIRVLYKSNGNCQAD